MNNGTIIEKFGEHDIAFDLFRGDLMVNATEMAKPFGKGKIPYEFLRTKQTKKLVKALLVESFFNSNFGEFPEVGIENIYDFKMFPSTNTLVEDLKIVSSKEGQHGGTYMCEDLALAFAMWLSPEFHVWILKMVREIIFGNNPELVREAVMNMPRIQKDLDKLRRSRNRMKAVILGPDRRKEMNTLINQRSSVSNQIQNLTFLPSIKSLKLDTEGLGARLIKLIEERDNLEEQIRKMNSDFDEILIKDKYLEMVTEIGQLEKEQKHFSKLIRYSDFKFSTN
jgi:hypothetical protein